MTQVTLKTIYDAIQDLRDEVKNTYVTQDSFRPVRAIVYGILGNMWAIRNEVAHYNLYLGFQAGATLMFVNQADNVFLDSTAPNTWVNTDQFAFNVIYQI